MITSVIIGSKKPKYNEWGIITDKYNNSVFSHTSFRKGFNLGEDVTIDTIESNIVNDIDDLLETSIEEIKRKINDDKSISIANKNKEIIRILYKQGLFKIKDSVIKIANTLGISKHTVYLHLRNFEKQ